MQIKNRLTYANVASTLALVIAVGGGGAAVAATVAKNSVGSPQIKAGAVQTSDLGANAVNSSKVKDSSLTGADIKESTLGTVPSAATAGNVLHAFVGLNGVVVASLSSAGVTAERFGAGSYGVTFNRDVTTCTPVASLGIISADQPDSGQIGTAPLEDTDDGVYVKTFNKDGDVTDRSFALTVVC